MDLPEMFWDLPCLEELSLARNRFRTIPSALLSITTLRRLCLRENHLRLALPTRFGQLDLRFLDVSHNELKDVNSLVHLANIERINLENNLLEVLPDIQTATLRELNVASNNLTYIPFSLGTAQMLKKLHLQNNKFEHFPDVVHQFSRLELLDLSSNNLESIPVLDLPSLRTLYLQNNPIKNCYEDFSRLRHLSTLDLGTFDFKEMRRPSRKRKPRENRTITSIEFSTSNV